MGFLGRIANFNAVKSIGFAETSAFRQQFNELHYVMESELASA
ncbi:hypothetical protein [Pseudovibrio sp. Tun.PSC04-5.I4]|nr:hypothetical protein [Pseudovibrio sp. Tun.PSC04-5.I4]SDR31555.1 hypothetical protein SAMN04515695_4406 [Pseudovibrio sp. Tun.PSC04-5.I4]